MKHLLLLAVVLVLGYCFWHVATRRQRRAALGKVRAHAYFVVVLLLSLLAVAFLAVNLSSLKVL